MKVISGYHAGADSAIFPTFGVYCEAAWELFHDKASPISTHPFFDATVAAAARDEVQGHKRVVVRFDPPSTCVGCRL